MCNLANSYYVILLAAICAYLTVISLRYDSYLKYCTRPICQNQLKNYYLLNYENIMAMPYFGEWQLQLANSEPADHSNASNKSAPATGSAVSPLDERRQPLRSVILSAWLSADTFLETVLDARPAHIRVAKPLSHFEQKSYKITPQTDEALDTLAWLLRRDRWDSQAGKLGWRELFAPRAPFRAIDVSQLSLSLMERFLNDKTLGIKVVLVIRDPRGVVLFRKRYAKCLDDIHCFDPSILCYDMVEDYRAAVRFSKQYPDSFRILRYEDLLLEPRLAIKELSELYGPLFQDDSDSIVRARLRSKDARFRWRQELGFEELEDIQRHCKLAMKLWGYTPVPNPYQQSYFEPMVDYALDDTYE